MQLLKGNRKEPPPPSFGVHLKRTAAHLPDAINMPHPHAEIGQPDACGEEMRGGLPPFCTHKAPAAHKQQLGTPGGQWHPHPAQSLG